MARVLAGRYTLEKVIGEGGMATVWRARDSRLERLVAVKVMAEGISNDPEFRARFMQEARAAASFSHANLVDVLDYGEEDGTPYIVMEIVEGEDLRARLARDGKLDPGAVARIGAGVARGLAAAHRRGLIHRDIKPANILLDGESTPKLTDFGIVRALGTATQTKAGTTLGSVHYLSPEQVQGAPVDARSDIYSLGVVLYEAATGERPFDDDAPAAIAVRRLSETPRPPHAVEPTLPQWLSSVIERAMARDPESRYRNAAELERDLETHRATLPAADPTEKTVGMPILAQGGAGRGAPRARVRSALPFALALTFGIAFVSLGLFFLLGSQPTAVVPSVVGMDRNAASTVLEDAGFAVRERGPDANERELGTVYRQSPEPPIRLPRGSTVTIFISAGPARVEVPTVRGYSVEDARKILESRGLQLGNTVDQYDDLPPNTAISSDPPAGTPVSPGSRVTINKSIGPHSTPTPSPTPTPTPSPTG